MPVCSIFGCKRRSETSNLQKDGVTFHQFPRDSYRRHIWTQACQQRITWDPKRTSTICSIHFEESCFLTLANKRRKLTPTAVPTLNLYYQRESETEPAEPETSENDEMESVFVAEGCATPIICAPEIPSPQSSPVPPQPSPQEQRLKIQLQMKNSKIKKLHSQIRYLKKKVARLQEAMHSTDDTSVKRRKRKKASNLEENDYDTASSNSETSFKITSTNGITIKQERSVNGDSSS